MTTSASRRQNVSQNTCYTYDNVRIAKIECFIEHVSNKIEYIKHEALKIRTMNNLQPLCCLFFLWIYGFCLPLWYLQTLLTATRHAKLCMRVIIALTCRKHVHGHIISPRVEDWAHKTSLTPPLFTEVTVPSQESQRLHFPNNVIMIKIWFLFLGHM